jgi:phosphatidylinositol alpha 1,6-mannosyltransferase
VAGLPAILPFMGSVVNENLRVAFFPDSYLEVNGAAMTCRRLTAYAKRMGYPMLCVHAGPKNEVTVDGSLTHFALKRSPLSFSLDEDLAYDPFFNRHFSRIRSKLLDFKPDVIHITGLNDISIIGAIIAWQMELPLLGSWHTNIHEFAASRIRRILRFMPAGLVNRIADLAEHKIMQGSILYYKMPKVILSPNQELVEDLGRRTKRVSRLMGRGVDPEFFSPSKRNVDDDIFRVGFVGRLRAEKNVRKLEDVEKAFIAAGKTDYELLVVGEGNEREYLQQHLKKAVFTGFLDGDELAAAYANMDVFVFPSETDAFGNVAQEALASGVPAIVSDKGGPKFIIEDGVSGFMAGDAGDYAKFALMLYDDRERLALMKAAARKKAMSHSWDSIFESVYDGYREAVRLEGVAKAAKNK